MKDQPGRLDQAAVMLSAAHQPCKDLPLETEGRNVAPQKQAAPFQAASVIDKDPPGQICPIFVGFDSLWPTRSPSLQEHGVSSSAPCSGASCVLCFGACSHPGEGFVYKYLLILLVGCRPALPQLHPLHGMGGRWALPCHGVPGTSLATCSMPRAL